MKPRIQVRWERSPKVSQSERLCCDGTEINNFSRLYWFIQSVLFISFCFLIFCIRALINQANSYITDWLRVNFTTPPRRTYFPRLPWYFETYMHDFDNYNNLFMVGRKFPNPAWFIFENHSWSIEIRISSKYLIWIFAGHNDPTVLNICYLFHIGK